MLRQSHVVKSLISWLNEGSFILTKKLSGSEKIIMESVSKNLDQKKNIAQPVALVTGGAQGLGLAIAKTLSRNNYKVYVCDINDVSSIAELNLEKDSKNIQFDKCDVTDLSQVESWINKIYENEKRIDVVVNNAAFVKWDDYDKMNIHDDIQAMEVGYHGMVYMIRTVLPIMEKMGHGHIVNMGSSCSKLITDIASASYNATKGAIDIYTQSLQLSYAGKNIHFTSVRPATIRGTDFFKKNVKSSRLPRLADYVTSLEPDRVAEKIFLAIKNKKNILDIPWTLKIFYFIYNLSPSFMRFITTRWGQSRKDYSK